MRPTRLVSFTVLLTLSLQCWSSIFIRKSEAIELTEENRKLIQMALEQLEPGLADKVKTDEIQAERYVDNTNQSFFSHEYPGEAVDDTYSRLHEVECKQDTKQDAAWNCKKSGIALVFPIEDKSHTIWIEQKIPLAEAIKIIEFLKTGPEHACGGLGMKKKPCVEKFDNKKLKDVHLIRHSFVDAKVYAVGDDRFYPSLVYKIEAIDCAKQPCPLKITGTALIMY